MEDYAARKGMALGEMEKWLSPNLGYEPWVGQAATVAAAEATLFERCGMVPV